MATSNPPGGMDHPTVVPANFESVEGGTGTDEEAAEGRVRREAADSQVAGTDPR